MRIVEVVPSPEDHDGYPYWRWQLEVVSGPAGVAPGLPRREVTTLKDGAKFNAASFLAAIGIDPKEFAAKAGRVQTYQQFSSITAAVHKAAKGRIVAAVYDDDRPYNGQPASRLINVRPEGEFEELREKWSLVAPKGNAPGDSAPPAGVAADLSEIARILDSEEEDLGL
jgi:hypothetical protein